MMRIIAFIMSLYLTPIFGNTKGIGDKISKPPKAICKVIATTLEKDFAICTGTLVKGKTNARFVGSGHCVIEFPKDILRIDCGCSKKGCEESFKFSSIPDIDVKNIVNADKTPVEDHAYMSLDHEPQKIEPLEMGLAVDYFDLEKGTLKPGVECIKGGYGETLKKLEMSAEPLMFKVNEIRTLSGITHKTASQLVVDVLARIPNDEYSKLRLCEERDYNIKPTDDPDEERRYLYARGYIPSSILQGDSGGPLLCRLLGADYVLVGQTIGILSQEKEGAQHFMDTFFLINPMWKTL